MDKSITNDVQLEAVKDNGGFIKNSSEEVKDLSFKRIRESVEKEGDLIKHDFFDIVLVLKGRKG